MARFPQHLFPCWLPPLFWKTLLVGPAISVNTTAVAAAPEPVPPTLPTLNAIAGAVVKPVPRCTIDKLLTDPVAASKLGDTFATVPM